MINDNPLLNKSLDFSVEIVNFFKKIYNEGNDLIIAKQLLRSSTSVGANINEGVYGHSKADFICKLTIALKEAGESAYWIKLLQRTDFYSYNLDKAAGLLDEIIRMLASTLKTSKEHAMN